VHTITIRKCKYSDFDGVYSLLKQLMPDQDFQREITAEIFNKGLNNADTFYFCASEGERIAGFCSLIISSYLAFQGDTGYIRELVVDEKYRRQNIGAELIEAARKQAVECGCMRIDLASASHRKAAHEFYEKLGFNRTAVHFTLHSIHANII
jgi:ribosomal protein S18 acetylase RimI-like enzyme